jgi:hypothetical protein
MISWRLIPDNLIEFTEKSYKEINSINSKSYNFKVKNKNFNKK